MNNIAEGVKLKFKICFMDAATLKFSIFLAEKKRKINITHNRESINLNKLPPSTF